MMSFLSKIFGWASPDAPRQFVAVLHHSATYVEHNSKTNLVASFIGLCGHGCNSADSVAQMDRVVWNAMCARRPDGLIMDFRRLQYEWGDNLTEPLAYHPDEKPDSLIDDDDDSAFTRPQQLSDFPVVYVVSDFNRKGLTSLMTDELFLLPSDYLFESLDAAIEAIANRLA